MIKKSISDFFRDETEKLVEDRLFEIKTDLIRKCKREVLFLMLNKYKRYFPITVVLNDFNYEVMRFIGNFKNKHLFYYCDNDNLLYKSEFRSSAHPAKVEKADEIYVMWKILHILNILDADSYFDSERDEEIFMPGFYLFRYKIRCISGVSGETKEIMSVVKANSAEEAIEKFDNEFCLNPGNSVMDFEIYVNSKWRKLVKENGMMLFSFNFHHVKFTFE